MLPMAKPTGFLEEKRAKQPYRPVAERLRDFRQVMAPYAAEPLNKQAARCMDCGIPFCHQGCPLGNLIPDWNDLVYRDRWDEAIERLHATNNFPEFTGTLCPAPCEGSCVLGVNDDPVTIKAVELAIIDRAFDGRPGFAAAARQGNRQVGGGGRFRSGRPRRRTTAASRRPQGHGLRAR
jgi:glutamate synthase (NADPH/NADH) small chain